MRIKSLFFAALATMALACCSDNEEIVTGNNPSDNGNAQAYMSLTVDMLSSMGVTRASTTETGTSAESKISKALVVFLDDKNTVSSTYELTAPSTAIASEPFAVAGAPKNLIVIANYTQAIKDLCAVGVALDAIKVKVLENTSIDDIATEGKFLMTTLELVSCADHIKTVSPSGPFHNIAAAKSAAITDPATALVDRVVSKVTLNSTVITNDKKATATVKKWGLDVMNTKFYLMPEKEEAVTTSSYYKDPNYDDNKEDILGDFTRGDLTDFATGNSKYCLENTMIADQQVNGYTTQALIQVEYTPDGYTAGSSWFRFRGKSYQTLTALQTEYTTAKAVGDNALTDACEAFFDAVKDKVTGSPADFGTLTIDELDKLADGGSASKAIEYYQKGLCYYPILIRHDSAITTPMALGRWGVVRNNWYNLTINSISEPGTPWMETPGIDDPATPEIENADDITKSYISVTITVNPWTKWAQSVDL